MLKTRSVTGSTHPYGSLVNGACVMSLESTQLSPWSQERIGFSIAMKNMQPLEVMPMLGSLPVSPTSLNTKSISRGISSTAIPMPSVTKIRLSISGSVSTSISTFSAPKQPAIDIVVTRRTNSIAFARMVVPVCQPIMTLRFKILQIPANS